tara:strand:- start:13572 stop:13907 length:336 start_codon:yes stop_codon:yes gene_type:complete
MERLVNVENIGGKIVKEDDRYVVRDNVFGNSLVLSSTYLSGKKSTTGHRHKGQEEVYIFIKGHGSIELDEETFKVNKNDIVCIHDGVFHRVHNEGDTGLLFITVFEGQRTH